MKKLILTKDSKVILKSDLAGERPLYFFKKDDRLCYTRDLSILLAYLKHEKLLQINRRSISFLLQNGTVPPPYTIYENLYMLGIGLGSEVTLNHLSFHYNFPFYNNQRKKENEFIINEDYILQSISKATIKKLDLQKPTFLFHSAGKDSNMIALSLHENDYKDNITLVTHRSKGERDESQISKGLAQKLKFKHIILDEIDILEEREKEKIFEYFTHISFPNLDNVALSYSLYPLQIEELYGANIIDGGGNDTYMGIPPNARDLKVFFLSQYLSKFSFVRKKVKSENIINTVLKTPLEWFGMGGLSHYDTKKILGGYSYDCADYWQEIFNQKKKLDLFDLKTEILTTNIALPVHIGKVRNFCDMVHGNIVLPFADDEIAKYYMYMPEKYLFDRKTYKNKLIFRKILRERLSLDSDKLGKKGYSFDSRSLVLNNLEYIKSEILKSDFWDKKEINHLIHRLSQNTLMSNRESHISSFLLYRLFLLSGWLNYNKYLN